MGLYGYSKEERNRIVTVIADDILSDLDKNSTVNIFRYFNDKDTYIRRAAYIAVGNIVRTNKKILPATLAILHNLITHESFHLRQSVINAAGEIGKFNFAVVEVFFDIGLKDKHYSPRNAVIGSIKKMGEKNPEPVLAWAKKYLHDPDKEIRREICHGIELRGRTHPEDILPLLKELQFDKTARVRNTLVHVIGQISYKKDCLVTVISELKTWENKELVADAVKEIIDVHDRYSKFAALTVGEAEEIITKKNLSL